MLLLWIVLLLGLIVTLEYAYLSVKRFILVKKISNRVKKQSGVLKNLRHPLTSVFRHDGKADFSVSYPERTIDISVVTTPLRRVRYHFDNNKSLELIIERRAVYLVNPRVPKPSAAVDRVYTIRKYRIKFDAREIDNAAQRYVILHPAPISVSKSDGATFTALYDNDVLFNKIRICGLKYFLERVCDYKT